MAKYRITGPDGGTYEITAPDDADQNAILDYAKTQFGGKQDRFAGWTDDMRKTYEQRKGAASPVSERMTDSALLGAKDEILAGLNTAVQAPFAFFQGDHDVSGRYDRNLKVERALRDDARAATPGVGGVALDLAGGLALGVPRAAMGVGSQVAQQSLPFLKTFANAAPQLAKTGAAWGAGQAFLDKDPSPGSGTMDGFIERAQEIPGGAAAGAAGAVALGGGLMGGLQARDWIRARRATRTNRNAAVADEMRSVGITEPFGPAVTDSGTAQRTATSLAESVVGAPIRRAAGQNIDEFERAAQQALRRPTDGMAPADLGAETQRVLRDRLTGHSIPGDEVRAMPDSALERLTGPVTEAGFRPPRPVVEPVSPRQIGDLDPQQFRNVQFDRAPLDPKYPTIDAVVPDARMASNLEIARPAADRARQFLDANAPLYDDAAAKIPRLMEEARATYGTPMAGGAIPPQMLERRAAIERELMDARSVVSRLRGGVEAARADVARFDGIANRIEAQRQSDWRTAVRDEHQRAQQAADAENASRQEAAAQRAMEAERARLESAAKSEADMATAERQRTADQEYERTASARPGFEPGRSRESYPTEFSAAYERVARETPTVQRNPLGHSPNDPNKTNTLDVLGQFADEARRGGLLPGSKRGEVFALQDKLLHPQFRSYLEKRIGKDITQRLDYFVERRSRGQFVSDTQGLKDIRTAIGREIGDLKQARKMGEPRSQDEAMLSRLYDALSRDMHSFLQTTPQGRRASGMIKAVDEAYRAHIEELRKPLSKIYGDKVQPIEAMDRLTKAAERGDLQSLRAFMRVMTEKADPVRAATSIIVHATDGAQSLQSFIKGFQSIPKDSRNVLFGTPEGKQLRAELETLERVGLRLAPYADSARSGGGVDLTRKSNILLAVGAMSHMWATMGTAIGAAGVSKFMASPRYLRWLTSTPKVMTGGLSSKEAAQHVARLQAITASDPQFGSDILKAARETFLPNSRAEGD